MRVEWLGHASFRMRAPSGTVVYTDPYLLDPDPEKADVVIVTHEHFDHCAVDKLKRIIKDDTIIVAKDNCKPLLQEFHNTIFLKTGDVCDTKGISVKAFQAYNIRRFRAPDMPFHPKGLGAGFLFVIEGVRFYIAGDTDLVPEMKELTAESVDAALLPIGGTYTMDVDEAASAALIMRPKVAIPMHYNTFAEIRADPKRFAAAVRKSSKDIEVRILAPLVKV